MKANERGKKDRSKKNQKEKRKAYFAGIGKINKKKMRKGIERNLMKEQQMFEL